MTIGSILIGHGITCKNGELRNYTESSVVIGNYAINYGANCINISGNTYDSGAVAIGGDANYQSVCIGNSSWTSNNAVAIGCGANSNSYGLAIGNSAYADYGNITLKSGNVEVKFTSEGMTLNGEPYGQGGSSGGTDYAQQMLYKVKYAHTDLNEVRNTQSSEWRDYYDEYGNSQGYHHYPYYDDITVNGEWYYDLKTTGGDFYSSQFQECPILKKFVAKISNQGLTYIYTDFFSECRNLEEVIIHVERLVEARNMFYNCPKLHTFYANLSQLEYGIYMFGSDPYNCTSLNVESVEHIANSIKSDCYGEIYIGMSRELQNDNGDGKYSRCQEALQKIRNKGWTVYEIYNDSY